MNAPVLDKSLQTRLSIVDCDIHPDQKSAETLSKYLPQRWQEHSKMFGQHNRQGLVGQLGYPRMMANGRRADSYPPAGGPPGSDLAFMKQQHLDPNGVEFGMLVALGKNGMEEQNQDYAKELSRAVNDWQIQEWVKPE